MILEAAFLLACAPNVAPATIEAIIAVESASNPLAINVNGVKASHVPRPVNADEATAIALAYIEQGYTVDMGLMQVNSANLDWLGVGVREMFDPCKNIGAGATVLASAYETAVLRHGEGQAALQAALSAYNTGSLSAGFANGYVARYVGAPQTLEQKPQGNPYAAPTAVPFTVKQSYWDAPETPKKKEIAANDPEDIAGTGSQAGEPGGSRTDD